MERSAPTVGVTLLCRGTLAAKQGDRKTALRMIERLNEMFRVGYAQQSNVGFIYFALGETDRYFEYMRQAAQAHTLQMLRIRFSPLLASARKDTRLLELLASYTRPSQPPK